jgi:hypothetical protein
VKGDRKRTSQPVNRPLLELLQRDICSRRCAVEVQPVRVGVLFPLGSAELFFAIVDDVATLAVNAVCICTEHLDAFAAVILWVVFTAEVSWLTRFGGRDATREGKVVARE